jgi:lipopolysaccharide/colanic/teichoic acid biosynthesis glycosyltransferase
VTYRVVKQILDRIVAAILLVGLSPVMLVVALAIFAESGTPVLFRQRRIGLGGAAFTVIKFRSLRDLPHDPGDPLSIATRIGRWLRRSGLDELPQVANILRGEMSFVGPRPALPAQVDRYGDFERRRLAVRPGITGLAQVSGRNLLSWQERIHLDVEYVDRMSFILDLRILGSTVRTVLSGRGVYGNQEKNPDMESSRK